MDEKKSIFLNVRKVYVYICLFFYLFGYIYLCMSESELPCSLLPVLVISVVHVSCFFVFNHKGFYIS